VDPNLSPNQTCSECGGYIGEGAFCARCGRPRAGALAAVGRPTTAAERLGVSFAPPPTPSAPLTVYTPTFSESPAAWSSESVAASTDLAPRRHPVLTLLLTVVFLIVAGKGVIVGYGYAKEALGPAALSEGDCISFDEQGLNPHVSSCGEIHFGTVVKAVEKSQDCAGITDYWIEKDDEFYCINKEA
jgi:hypothetical protein